MTLPPAVTTLSTPAPPGVRSYVNQTVSAPQPSPPRYRSNGLDRIPRGAKVLWVTSTGGHLAELALIAERLEASAASTWVTFETEQSADFLRYRPHLFVDHVAPRDLRAAVRAARRVAPLLKQELFHACISTGAAVAATVLPMAAWAGVPTYYVESLARPSGPSATGKILQRVPGVETLTQYPGWASERWSYAGSALDQWHAVGAPARPAPLKILVTLGTIAPYRFDLAVDAVLGLLREGDEVVWQLGSTSRTDLPGRVLRQVSARELDTLSRAADVVVAHSGVGSVLQQFGVGNSPVLAVRRSDRGEHVDNHQIELAESLAERELVSVLDLDRPSRRSLEVAAGRRVFSAASGDDVVAPPAVRRVHVRA